MTTKSGTVGCYLHWMLVALSLGAGVIHFAETAGHFDVSWAHGLFFAVTAWLQLSWAAALIVKPTRRLLVLGAAGNGVVIATWLVSRVWGVPVGPDAWTPEPVALADALGTGFEAGIVLLSLVVLARPALARQTIRPTVGFAGLGASGLAVAVVTTMALAPAFASDHHHGSSTEASGQGSAPRSRHDHRVPPNTSSINSTTAIGSVAEPGGSSADWELEKQIPDGLDVFNLSLAQTREFSASEGFEVVGHSYLEGPWLTDFATEQGMGGGFNTVRVHDGIAYLAGYNYPPTAFGILIADVRDPANITPLSFIPCHPGARCPYLRVDPERDLLVFGNDSTGWPLGENPEQPPPGEQVRAGVSFYDVANPRNPRELAFIQPSQQGTLHGLDIDGRYVYACADAPESQEFGTEELQIIDAVDPRDPRVVGRVHVQGQHAGEDYGPNDRLNPNGSSQIVRCHEVVADGNRAYVAWRDAGMVVVDVSNRRAPSIIGRSEYVGPFNGGWLGAAHSFAPVPTADGSQSTLAVLTDEIFDCPPGFGRIVDISSVSNMQVVSSFRIPALDDAFDHESGGFVCPPGQQSVHLPWFDYRSPSLMYVTWYDQGVRAWDISNPFLPQEAGYYISPQYAVRGIPDYPPDRHSREVYQDPATGLIYLTDGNGGGLTILRWTGEVPEHPPIPAAR
jgi:hypothetical protein